MDENIRKILDSQDWDDLLSKLLAYSIWLCRVKYRNAQAIDPEDLLMDSVEKIYSGSRHWNREQDPDLFRFLQSVIESHLSNTLTKGRYSNRHVPVPDDAKTSNDTEDRIYFTQINTAVTNALDNDAEVCLTYKALKDGLKPGEIANEYGINITIIRNAMKRLRRLMIKIIPSLNKKTN